MNNIAAVTYAYKLAIRIADGVPWRKGMSTYFIRVSASELRAREVVNLNRTELFPYWLVRSDFIFLLRTA